MSAAKTDNGPSRADERRQALVHAAYQCIAERGLQGLRTRGVAAQVGMTHATLHYYFPTKQALIEAVIKYAVFQRIVAAGGAAPYALGLEGLTPRESLHSYLIGLQQRMQEDPTTFLVLYELLRHAQHDPAIRDLFIQPEIYGNWQRSFVSLLKDGMAQGQFRADLNPDSAASILMTFFLGMGTTILAPVPTPPGEMVDQLERWLLK